MVKGFPCIWAQYRILTIFEDALAFLARQPMMCTPPSFSQNQPDQRQWPWATHPLGPDVGFAITVGIAQAFSIIVAGITGGTVAWQLPQDKHDKPPLSSFITVFFYALWVALEGLSESILSSVVDRS